MRTAAVSVLLFLFVAVCLANESVIEYAGVQKANSLSGVITDQAGAPIEQVTVQEMSDDWGTVLQATATDVNGRWSLAEIKGRKIHRIRFVKPAFHQVHFSVRLTNKKAKPLDFVMPVS